MIKIPINKIKVNNILFFTVVFLIFFLIFCLDTNGEIYEKRLLFKGKSGSKINELKYLRESDGLISGPWSFLVYPNKYIMIYDPNNNMIKKFSYNGGFIGEIKLDKNILIDDLILLKNNNILCRTWGNYLVFISSEGKAIKKYKLPPGGASSTSLFKYKDDVFLYHYLKNEEIVGLRYKLGFELPAEIKKSNFNLWVETGGLYYSKLEDYKEKDILKPDSSSLIKDPDPKNFIWRSIGVDKNKNLYLIINIKRKDKNVQPLVRKYSEEGKKIAEFEILPYDYLPESHLIKLDKNGSIYLLYVPDNWNSWEMYRYSVKQ
jgi:hypothetical protein